MELWIRSQDKGVLTKANNLIVFSNNTNNTSFSIKNFEQDDSTNLGFYKTKERALEVLDEIQRLLMPAYLISNISKEDGLKLQDHIAFATSIIQTEDNSKIEQINGSIIYQMPKE